MRYHSKHFVAVLVSLSTACFVFFSYGSSVAADGTARTPQPRTVNPALGQSVDNAGFSYAVTRVTDSTSRKQVGAEFVTKTDYSRIQAENSDGSQLLVLATNDDGLLQYALVNTRDLRTTLIVLPASNISGISWLHDETEARWHPNEPDVIRFIKGQNSYVGGLQVYEYNTRKRKVKLLADLRGKLPAHWGKELYGMTHHEGEYSRDGNRLAWAIESGHNNSEEPVGYVAFDLRGGGKVLGTLDHDGRNHDHLSISPSGEYVVISAQDKTSAYPVDFSTEQVLMWETQHSDLCTTPTGVDCYVSVSFDDTENPEYGWIYVEELGSGKRTRLIDVFGLGNTSLHLSARSFKRPGWALLSTYNCATGDSHERATALCDRISLIELSSQARVIPLAWTQSSGENYYREPHASLNADGSRAYFNSDWGNAKQVDVYRIDIPSAAYR